MQKVMVVIEVPQGEYCWEWPEVDAMKCRYFNAVSRDLPCSCHLDIGEPIASRVGYRKPASCRELVIVDETEKPKPAIQSYSEAWKRRVANTYFYCWNCQITYLDDEPSYNGLTCPNCNSQHTTRGIDKDDLPEEINA